MIDSKWSNFIGCYAWQRMVIGREKSGHCQTLLERRSSLNENLQRKLQILKKMLEKSRHCQTWLERPSSFNENLQRKQNWKCWKNQVSFCHGSSPVSRKAWTLPWKLQELKNTRGKLVVTVNLEPIWFEFWMKGAKMTVILKSVWYSVTEDKNLLRHLRSFHSKLESNGF